MMMAKGGMDIVPKGISFTLPEKQIETVVKDYLPSWRLMDFAKKPKDDVNEELSRHSLVYIDKEFFYVRFIILPSLSDFKEGLISGLISANLSVFDEEGKPVKDLNSGSIVTGKISLTQCSKDYTSTHIKQWKGFKCTLAEEWVPGRKGRIAFSTINFPLGWCKNVAEFTRNLNLVFNRDPKSVHYGYGGILAKISAHEADMIQAGKNLQSGGAGDGEEANIL